jgi:transposase
MQVTLNEIAEKMGIDYNTIWKRAKEEGWKPVARKGVNGAPKLYDLSTLPEDVQEAFSEDALFESSLNIRISELQFFVKKFEEIMQKLLELSGLSVKGVKRVLINTSGYEIELTSEALISFVKRYGLKVSKYVTGVKNEYWVWVRINHDIVLFSIVRKEEFQQYFKV